MSIHIQERAAQLKEVQIPFDTQGLSESELAVVRKLVDATDIVDDLFLRQVYNRNPKLLEILERFSTPDDSDLLRYFKSNGGPWDRFRENEPFIAYIDKRPKGVELYPRDMTREEFNVHLRNHPGDEKDFKSYFTVIQRSDNGSLIAVPYSVAYREHLERLSSVLREAADLAENETLKRFLKSRADAFLSNNYVESDVDWMNIEGVVDPTIGPYEPDIDQLFGYKAGFQSRLVKRDREANEKLIVFNKHLADIDRSLPIDPRHRFTRKKQVPRFVVGDNIYAGGDGRYGYVAVAYALPNDEETTAIHGTKKTLLRNMLNARLGNIILPLSHELIDPKQLENVTEAGHFYYVFLHELSHGLGPAQVVLDDHEITLRNVFADSYGPLEEAKADIYGLYLGKVFAEKGVLSTEIEYQMYVSHLASIFRTLRLGLDEIHARGELVEYNYLKEKGAFRYDAATGRFGVDYDRIRDGVYDLLMDFLNIQASGDPNAARGFLEQYGRVPDEIKSTLERVGSLPIEILPVYQAAA